MMFFPDKDIFNSFNKITNKFAFVSYYLDKGVDREIIDMAIVSIFYKATEKIDDGTVQQLRSQLIDFNASNFLPLYNHIIQRHQISNITIDEDKDEIVIHGEDRHNSVSIELLRIKNFM